MYKKENKEKKKVSNDTNQEEKENFIKEMRELIIDWYSNCPHAMQFTSKAIRSYKQNFPDDDFMDDVNRNI
jgi:hypothetical protein